MATCLQVILPMVRSVSSSSASTLLNSQPLKKRSHTLKFNCYASLGGGSFGEIPMPPLNPTDPFLRRLASVAADAPESPNDSPERSDEPRTNLLELLPRNRSRAKRKSSRGGSSRKELNLATRVLDSRIVYVGMPLVSAVSGLVIAQLMALQGADPKEPIYMYINSTGTTRDDGEKVAREYEGFAIYDVMMSLKTEIRTVVMGYAIGHACLLAAAGKKGERYMYPDSKVMIHQPQVSASGLMPASDVLIHANEAKLNRDTLVELLAEHTGNSVETVAHKMRAPYYMDVNKAIEFGVVDKIVTSPKQIRAEVPRSVKRKLLKAQTRTAAASKRS